MLAAVAPLASNTYMDDSLKGRLLLAAPTLQDPNFARSVVLIGAHSEDGAMGVVLNRPSSVTVAEAVPQLGEAVGDDEPVYVGGPVQQSSIVVLAEFQDSSQAGLLVLDTIGFPASDADLDDLVGTTLARPRVRRLRRLVGPAAGGGDRGRRLDLPRGRTGARLL